MLEGGPLVGNLDDQTVEVLDFSAVAGLKYKEAARAYIHLLYDGGLL
jgi:hypothetical protein